MAEYASLSPRGAPRLCGEGQKTLQPRRNPREAMPFSRLAGAGRPLYVANNSQLQIRRSPLRRLAWVLVPFLAVAAAPASADTPQVAIAIRSHSFVPSEVQIPAGIKVELLVRNQDPTPSEFESTELHREKVVTPGQQISVFVGPLQPGRYAFFDDFHPQTQGTLVVK
jgi:plastocyanin